MEDYHDEVDFSTPSGYWSFYAVLDGHQGWQTSAWLKTHLIHAVAGFIGDVYTRYEPLFEEHSHIENTSLTNENPRPPPAAIDNAIKDAFKSLDDDIVERAVEAVFASPSKADAVRQLGPACAGSSALLAFYERRDRLLRIAITGDSRAVLGRRTKSSDLYEVHVLSVKPHPQNDVEGIRLSPFPRERAAREGQILGSGRSRSFGDAAYKWSAATRTRLSREYLWKKPSLDTTVSTPLTAEPEVTTTEIQPGDFLILGTNGLWESLTNEEAVGLVGWWQSEVEKGVQKKKRRENLPVLALQERTAPMTPHRWRPEKEFVNVDRNAATHLARNALGGADFDLTEALLNVAAPHTRRYRWVILSADDVVGGLVPIAVDYRDDLTAIVIFFDKEWLKQ
jgi:pyruvate dehydrogenase phosphatase